MSIRATPILDVDGRTSSDHSVRKTFVKKLTGLEFLSSFFQFVHSGEPYSGSNLPNSSPVLSWLSGDDKLRSCVGVFQQSSN